MPKVLLSSTVITPSLPTLSKASASVSPTAVSAAEMDATDWTFSLSVETGTAWSASESTAAATAASMPRLRPIGLAPAATLRSPSRTRA